MTTPQLVMPPEYLLAEAERRGLKIPRECPWRLAEIATTDWRVRTICLACDARQMIYVDPWPPSLSSPDSRESTTVDLTAASFTDGHLHWLHLIGQCPDCLTCYWSARQRT